MKKSKTAFLKSMALATMLFQGFVWADNDANIDKLVYVDKSQFKYYEFDQIERKYRPAEIFCQRKGLRLMSRDQARGLIEEMSGDRSNLLKWNRGSKRLRVWGASKYKSNSQTKNPELFAGFGVQNSLLQTHRLRGRGGG